MIAAPSRSLAQAICGWTRPSSRSRGDVKELFTRSVSSGRNAHAIYQKRPL